MPTSLTNIRLVTPGRDIESLNISVNSEGLISGIGGGTPDGEIFDAEGLLAFAGFIDIHTHGANGGDVTHGTEDSLRIMAEAKLREGVTTFLPTTWTEAQDVQLSMARGVAAYREREDFARTPALHVEGPYLNPAQAGAQNPDLMRAPNVDEVRELAAICPVALLSLAVELDGAEEFIAVMKGDGIVTSAAHSAATREDFIKARAAGLAHLTHYCNQMSPLHHRSVGLVGSGLLDDEVLIELICDTIHLCPDMIELVFKLRSTDQLMLITDSIAASHLGDGTYKLGEAADITVIDGVARIAAGNLAGSTLQFHDGLRNVAGITGLPLPELAKCTAANQARSLGLTDRGRLEPGLLADIVLLNDDFGVEAVFVGGERKV